jgi:hypothetical protein
MKSTSSYQCGLFLAACIGIYPIAMLAADCIRGEDTSECYKQTHDTYGLASSKCPDCPDYWQCNGSGEETDNHVCSSYAMHNYSSCSTYSFNVLCVRRELTSPNCPTDCGTKTTIVESQNYTCYDVNAYGCD